MKSKTSRIEHLSDAELLSLAIEKDVFAIRVITERFNQRLFRTAWSVLRDHSEAEDVVQESYLKAFKAIETFSGQSSLSTWLTRITLNTALDAKRSLNRRPTLLNGDQVILLEQYRSSFSTDETPDYYLMRNEFSKVLKTSLEQLPAPYRTVFILREIEELSVQEVANILSIQESTVKSRLFRARRQLRKDLEPEFGEFIRNTLPFAGSDCEAMTNRVFAALKISLKGNIPNE